MAPRPAATDDTQNPDRESVDDPPRPKVLIAWHANGSAWIDTIERNAIASRVATTHGAIVRAVPRHAPHTVLDVGCGEGRLVRALLCRVSR